MSCIEHDRPQNRDGYAYVRRGSVPYLLHRLLCALAYNLSYDGEWVTRHTCGNSRCIRIEHLVPGTQQENCDDMVTHGTRPRGDAHHNAKLTEADIAFIKNDTTHRGYELAAMFNVAQSSISRVRKGKQRW
jgi:hypothetical protein